LIKRFGPAEFAESCRGETWRLGEARTREQALDFQRGARRGALEDTVAGNIETQRGEPRRIGADCREGLTAGTGSVFPQPSIYWQKL